MKIKRISWQNFKGLQDNTIDANGQNVYVSGRNGVGKSTIANIVPFVLFGKSGRGKAIRNLRRFDDSGLALADGLAHFAEIAFVDGTILRRETIDTAAGGSTSNYYINGNRLKNQAQFDAFVMNLTHNAGELILNPFQFCEDYNDKERRAFILKNFGGTSEKKLLDTPEFAHLKELFGGLTADAFIQSTKKRLAALQKDNDALPGQISELIYQLAELPTDLDAAIADVKAQIAAKNAERSKLQTAKPVASAQIRNANDRISYLQRLIKSATADLEEKLTDLEKLRDEYRRIQAVTSKKCPTCGQPLPKEQFDARKQEAVDKNCAKGFKCADAIKTLKQDLSKYNAELADLKALIDKLTADAQAEEQLADERANRLAALDNDIADLTAQLANLQNGGKNKVRLEKLRADEKNFNQHKADLERNIEQAQDFIQTTVEAIEEQVNSHFSVVRFKLFDVKVGGELTPKCEPMLDGVPYSALSKGEKFKVAIDILNALQKLYGVELPLIIDDCESYTPNSFVDIPNQVFTFRVVDDDLTIVIDERSCAA